MEKEKVIKVGTRGSLLALEQTERVIAALTEKYPQLHIEKVILRTQGDKILDKPLYEFGGKGMFITEFEEALAEKRIDLAIHSAKDMPIDLADGMIIAGVLKRADVRDVLVTKKGASEKLLIGTGSLRRQFQLKEIYPAAECISIRGNVPTRLQKVRDGEVDVLSPDCEKIYVGKEAGKHYKRQEEINRILVECAKKHKNVVRLKGGDPFVFGRGGEEIEALRQYNIPYEVIPGVTSAVDVPECAGIPVTHRGVARSFHVITGHTKNSVGSPEYDYETLGKTEGTLVFLMGLSNLGEIADKLIFAGKPANTPVAVISDGTTACQKVVKGRLENIVEKVNESNLKSPAIIVIGETAEYEYRYAPVNGKKVGITATEALREKLQTGLEELGMQPIPVCKMKVVPAKQMQDLYEELKHLEKYQWILFTSQNAIRLFFQKMKQWQVDIRALGSLKFAVLGSGTAAKLLEYGIKADFIPSAYTVSTLGEEFVKLVKPKERVLIPRAVQGSKELTSILKREQVDFTDLSIYDVVGSMTKNISLF